jgi:ankyrin repeat protein
MKSHAQHYRSSEAQEFHTSLFNYAEAEAKSSQETEIYSSLEKLCKHENAENFLTESSLNGHSILVDIFHLISDVQKDKALAAERIQRLLALLIDTQLPKTRLFLWTAASDDGFTPLHEALKEGNSENLTVYFTELTRLYADGRGILGKEAYLKLLTSENSAGFTPLHEALIKGNPQNLTVYFTELKQLYGDGQGKEAYLKLLTSENKAGFTPLHQAAASDKLDIVKAYIQHIQGVLPKEEAENMIQWLLNRKTEKGFLPNSRNNPDINRYLQTLSWPDYRKQEDSKKERPYSRNDYRETREDFRRSDYRRDERSYREDERREREPERRYYTNDTSRNTMFGNRSSDDSSNPNKRKDREYDKNLPNKRKLQ